MTAEPIHTFRNAPVTETVLAIGFDPVPSFNAAHLGLYWSSVREAYPAAEELPRYEMPIELLDGDQSQQTLSIRLGGTPTQPRVALYSPDRSLVCQVQQDWFSVNWRQAPIGTAGQSLYQRYSNTREQFSEQLADFRRFVKNELDHDLQVRQAEITYVNTIPLVKGLTPQDVLSAFGSAATGLDLTQAVLSQAISGPEGRVGRLHMTANTALRPSGVVLVLNLTSRGRPANSTETALIDFMDVGRRSIVEAFKNVTTERMHDEWQLEQP